ncbi:MAG: hypothetical protein AAF570_10445 [Bacteroidota bacterium]
MRFLQPFILFISLLVFAHTSLAQTDHLRHAAPEISFPGLQDTGRWSQPKLRADTKYFASDHDYDRTHLPMEILPFPVIEYDFGATGTGTFFIDKPFRLTAAYFLIGKHDYNATEFQSGETHFSFCNLLVLTDTLDKENYDLAETYVTSRNHPDYVGQGRIRLKHQNIDFVAFHRHDHSAYLIVGTRLFDLRQGQTILIAPQKDRSVRFLQLRTPRLTSTQLESYFQNLPAHEIVQDFFAAPGNIE